MQYTQLNCTSSISSSIKAQNRPCAAGLGRWYDLGFEVLGAPFIRYFQSCYNLDKSSVVYSEHDILGASIESKKDLEFFPRVVNLSFYTHFQRLKSTTIDLRSRSEA